MAGWYFGRSTVLIQAYSTTAFHLAGQEYPRLASRRFFFLLLPRFDKQVKERWGSTVALATKDQGGLRRLGRAWKVAMCVQEGKWMMKKPKKTAAAVGRKKGGPTERAGPGMFWLGDRELGNKGFCSWGRHPQLAHAPCGDIDPCAMLALSDGSTDAPTGRP